MFYENVSELWELSVRRNPGKTALIFGEDRYTYAEADRRINRIATGLRARGVNPGDHVAFLFPNCPEIVLIYYAIQKLGAVAIPLNFRMVPREIGFLLSVSESETFIFSSDFADKVSEICGWTGRLVCDGADSRFPMTLAELEASGTETPPEPFRDPGAVSRIQFTGGSTGIPKGVMRTHAEDIAEIIAEMLYSGLASVPDAVVLIQCPLEHHGGHSWFTATLSAGGTLVICAQFNPEKILTYIERERVTYTLMLPPTTYLRLCEHPNVSEFDTSSVRMVQSAAGATTPEIVARIREVFPNADIYYGWGQTESGLGTSIVLTRELEGHPERIGSIGKPMPFVEMKIVDDAWNELPDGSVGEAAVRSPACMKGYYAQDALTGELMGPGGWMLTGDLMRRDRNGYFYMLARKKNMIKSGGENVFSDEVEKVAKTLPSVLECVVIGVPDERLGEAVMAIVQLRPGKSLTLPELQEHCKNYISSYKKPLYLEFVDSFDMNDAGKIRRDELRRRFAGESDKA